MEVVLCRPKVLIKLNATGCYRDCLRYGFTEAMRKILWSVTWIIPMLRVLSALTAGRTIAPFTSFTTCTGSGCALVQRINTHANFLFGPIFLVTFAYYIFLLPCNLACDLCLFL